MPPSFFAPRRRLLVLLAGALVAGCDAPPETADLQEVRDRLVGTWLREYAEDGFNVRRVLVLEADGHFREMSRITELGASQADHSHAGEWLFDGTNLKRRYTSVDGKLPAAPAMPYATFELKFRSHNEFTGIDNVRKREVEYRRVADGTLP
ncbi:MAG: hypothetical protein JWQ07_1474 [Ramlibacter sp.]|nr:hypothetical protein [Ramlibacter sp.]